MFGTHSLRFFYTGSYGVMTFPEFVGVVMVDEVEVIYCDSSIGGAEPKQDWMRKLIKDDPEHMDWYSNECHTISVSVSVSGVHIYQRMFGCEWDDETAEVNGYDQYGYDGEDFIEFDLKTETWIAPTPQAVTTKHKWDNDRAGLFYIKNYLTQVCPEWLKKYVNYGRSSLLRTGRITSDVVLERCHATGFYPDRAMMFWRKDGEELDEDVDQGEILPNHDGTFQMSVDLKSPAPGDWERYECVFQLSGVKEDIIKRLDKAGIRTNRGQAGITGNISGKLTFSLFHLLCYTFVCNMNFSSSGFLKLLELLQHCSCLQAASLESSSGGGGKVRNKCFTPNKSISAQMLRPECEYNIS
uniref:Ig-like domain-containing protein n=1 Tax=Lates calcarifer TaxID=8187 RepID=A0A4W6FNV0_LATCA